MDVSESRASASNPFAFLFSSSDDRFIECDFNGRPWILPSSTKYWSYSITVFATMHDQFVFLFSLFFFSENIGIKSTEIFLTKQITKKNRRDSKLSQPDLLTFYRIL